jgi:hypothetical protein
MKYQKSLRGTNAVSGVIEALLLVALAAIVLSVIQLSYIPQVMKDREAAHMDEVSNQFSHLKAMIDIQSITQSDVPISSPITLGSGQLPYFITAPASGVLSITEDEFTIVVTPGLAGVSLDSVKYEAFNSYFDDQTYILEGGGIILRQPTGQPVMRVDPAITVDNGSEVTISFTIYNVEGTSGGNTTSGRGDSTGKCFIRTNYSDSTVYPQFTNITSIKIYTSYTNAWNKSIHNLLGSTVNISEVPSDDPIYVRITPNELLGKTVNLDLKIVDIKAQIGPGFTK